TVLSHTGIALDPKLALRALLSELALGAPYRPTASRMSLVIDWRRVSKPSHGSLLSWAARRGTVRMVNSSGPREGLSSSHESGVETVAPSRARVDHAPTAVAPCWLRR